MTLPMIGMNWNDHCRYTLQVSCKHLGRVDGCSLAEERVADFAELEHANTSSWLENTICF
jgi:hypothetical protein